MLVNPSIRKVTYEHSIRFEDFESVTSCFNRLSQSQWTDAKDVSERLGITQQTYARLEANPASAGFERLFRVFSVLGVEIVLSSRNHCQMQSPNTELCTIILHFQPGGRNGDAWRFPV